ncbi:hypothetical protein HWV62_25514 [Athelia sp. TMB]|nr:hypothetical protein HWV62_25514 [Athelia sp. TMB]
MGQITTCSNCGGYISDDVAIPPSPTPSLWRTWQAPDAQEYTRIGTLVSDAQSTLFQIEEQITEMQTKLSELLQKQKAMEQILSHHKSFLSPIRRLPAEILTYIFFLCLPVSTERSSFSIKRAPLLLTRVCTAWKDFAYSSQHLWASLTISKAIHPSIVESWLSHAKSSPLSIRMKLRRTGRVILAWPATSKAIQYCDRWKELDFFPASASILSRFGSVRHRLWWLEKLSLDIINDHIEPIDIFEFSPRLRHVNLKSVIKPSRLYLPWSQLETLEILVGGMPHLLAILDLSINIVNLTLHSSKNEILDQSSLGPFILHRLISLKVLMPCDIQNLCAKIRCPKLKSLEILTSASSLESPQLSAFLASSPLLERLTIQYHKPGYFPDLVSCLSAVPTLSILELDMCWEAVDCTSTVLEEMVCLQGGGGCLLPALEELSVQGPELDGDFLAKMILFRNEGTIGGLQVSPLKRLRLYTSPQLPLLHADHEELDRFFNAIKCGKPLLIAPFVVMYELREHISTCHIYCNLSY